jgi:hypothetical protein
MESLSAIHGKLQSAVHFLIPARSRSGRSANAKTGPKLCEELYREALGHDVSKLVSGGNMKNPDLLVFITIQCGHQVYYNPPPLVFGTPHLSRLGTYNVEIAQAEFESF